MSNENKQDKIIIFDTTLRDGEQSPGATMNMSEKLQIARLLDEMGVDVIEAGFAIASKGDFESVHEIAKVVKNATVCSLARARQGDIEAAGEALKSAKRGRIHTFISTSPIHLKYQIKMTEDEVLEEIRKSVSYARQFTDDVEWSGMDATRTGYDYLCKAVEVAIKAGARTVNIPDTVGYTLPEEFAKTIRYLRNNVPNIDQAIISVHCHNDLGLATANSLSAIKAGARQIECTINGLGERAGNAAMEEVVMAIKTRNDFLPFTTTIDTTQIMRASRLVSTITGFVVQKNKAIVGSNAFAHESGIHQDGVLKNANTYEIMKPEDVGLSRSNLVMGKHSGRHAFKAKLEDLGIELGDNALEEAFNQFKNLADKKKDIYDEDIIGLLDHGASHGHAHVKLTALQITCGTGGHPVCDITLDYNGTSKTTTTDGDGPVDALFKGIRALVPVDANLDLYQVHAVTQGTDAQAEVTVVLKKEGRVYTGNGRDTDTMVASAHAYLNAVDKILAREQKLGGI